MKFQVINDFLTAEECSHIIEHCRPLMTETYSPNPDIRASVVPVKSNYICNNFLSYVRHGDTAIISQIVDKISKYTGFGLEYFEPVQVLRYHIGGYYRLHVDNNSDPFNESIPPRKYTFQVYLNDVDEGGETYFPKMDLSFKPKQGRAIFWENFPDSRNGEKHPLSDNETIHEGKEVKSNEKWGLTQWIKLRPMAQPPSRKVAMVPKVIKASNREVTFRMEEAPHK